MSTQLIMKITAAGYTALANQTNTGLQLDLTHFQFGSGNRTPDGSEVALIAPKQASAITDGQKLPVNGKLQLRMSALFEGVSSYQISEIGVWAGSPGVAGSVLFAYWSQSNGKVAEMSVGVDFFYTHDMPVEAAVGAALNIIIDPSASTAVALMTSHNQAADPHPQYWNDVRGGNKLKALGLGTDSALGAADANDRTDLSVFKYFAAQTLNNTLSSAGTADSAIVLSKITGTASFNLAGLYSTANTKPMLKFRLGNTSAWGGWRALATLDPRVTDPQVPACFSISSLPTVNIGPIFVLEAEELWTWKSTAYFQGYRSILCGRPVDGHTTSPLASEIDAVGGLLSKTAYAGLWGYAQENNLVLTQANWTANIGGHYFVDVDANNFRVPDLRNMFRRYTGTDADTANARARGSRQLDALQNITGNFGSQLNIQTSASGAFALAASGTGAYPTGNSGDFNQFTFNASRVARTSTETRATNTAYSPRLHI